MNNERELYVYKSDMFSDLFELVTEYMGEAQHEGLDNVLVDSDKLFSSTTAMHEFRKKELQRDFIKYFYSQLEQRTEKTNDNRSSN